MYDAIRNLIRENRIADALRAMDDLDLGREHASRLDTLHRRWRILENKAMGNLSEERLLRIEENGIVEDMLKLLDHAEHPLTEPQEIPHAGAPAGAVIVEKPDSSGTGDGRTAVGRLLPWLLAAGVLVAIAVVWNLRPESPPQDVKQEIQEATEEPAPPATTPPTGTTTTPVSPTTTSPATTSSADLRDALKKTDLSDRLNRTTTTIRPEIADALKDRIALNKGALISSGPRVPMTLAVYIADKAPTKYSPELTKYLGAFLRTRLQREISIDVLTDNFHEWDGRERMQLRGVVEDDRLNRPDRTPYILLVDIRNVRSGKGEIRTCLFDVNRMKGFTRGKGINIGSVRNPNRNEILKPVLDYLTELRERDLFQ